jgi:hypothetical protein
LYSAGDPLCSLRKSEKFGTGDVVCIWFRSEFSPPGRHQAWLKRVRLNVPPWVKKFPYNDHPESDVKAIMVVEQLNPPQCYSVPCDQILAIHKGNRIRAGRSGDR